MQALLGHSHLSSTAIYLRIARLDQLRDAMGGRTYDDTEPPPAAVSDPPGPQSIHRRGHLTLVEPIPAQAAGSA